MLDQALAAVATSRRGRGSIVQTTRSTPSLGWPGIMATMCGRMVVINLKKLAGLEGKGRTIHDLVRTYIDRNNLAPKQ